MSDVWEDEDQQDIESRQLNGEWNARRAQFYNVSCSWSGIVYHAHQLKSFVYSQTANKKSLEVQEGYREGVETGRGQTLQEGFDKGTPKNAQFYMH